MLIDYRMANKIFNKKYKEMSLVELRYYRNAKG